MTRFFGIIKNWGLGIIQWVRSGRRLVVICEALARRPAGVDGTDGHLRRGYRAV